MKIFLWLIILTGLSGWAMPAYADLDQLCLKQCVNGGGVAGACMAQCSYGRDAGAATVPKPAASPLSDNLAPTNNVLSPHRVLDAPVVSDDSIVLKPKPASVQAGKDYTCFNQCLHQGQAYGQCEQSCTKTGCASGVSLCRDQTTIGTSGQVSTMVGQPLAAH